MSPNRVEAVFHALSDPSRRTVMERIAEAGDASATELAAELPISRQAIAKHLASLGEAGLVESERAGRERRYRLTPGPLEDAMGWMNALGTQWESRLDALRDEVERG